MHAQSRSRLAAVPGPALHSRVQRTMLLATSRRHRLRSRGTSCQQHLREDRVQTGGRGPRRMAAGTHNSWRALGFWPVPSAAHSTGVPPGVGCRAGVRNIARCFPAWLQKAGRAKGWGTPRKPSCPSPLPGESPPEEAMQGLGKGRHVWQPGTAALHTYEHPECRRALHGDPLFQPVCWRAPLPRSRPCVRASCRLRCWSVCAGSLASCVPGAEPLPGP